MITTRLLLSFLAAPLLLLAACGGQTDASAEPRLAETVHPDEGPQVSEREYEMPVLAAPPADHALYVAYLKDSAGRAVGGVNTQLLSEEPEPMDMRQPRTRHREGTYPSPRHGRVHYAVPADGKPHYLWVGGRGMDPFVRAFPAAVAGRTEEMTVTVDIVPTCTLVIEDHQGWRVSDAIVDMRPVDPDSLVAKEGFTRRSDDSGTVQFNYRPGSYKLSASQPNGRQRVNQALEWDGRTEPIVIRLANPK